MKKLLLATIMLVAFASCSSDDSNSCNCTKSYYNVNHVGESTFVNSETVDCTEEVEIQYIDSDTYFSIDCN